MRCDLTKPAAFFILLTIFTLGIILTLSANELYSYINFFTFPYPLIDLTGLSEQNALVHAPHFLSIINWILLSILFFLATISIFDIEKDSNITLFFIPFSYFCFMYFPLVLSLVILGPIFGGTIKLGKELPLFIIIFIIIIIFQKLYIHIYSAYTKKYNYFPFWLISLSTIILTIYLFVTPIYFYYKVEIKLRADEYSKIEKTRRDGYDLMQNITKFEIGSSEDILINSMSKIDQNYYKYLPIKVGTTTELSDQDILELDRSGVSLTKFDYSDIGHYSYSGPQDIYALDPYENSTDFRIIKSIAENRTILDLNSKCKNNGGIDVYIFPGDKKGMLVFINKRLAAITPFFVSTSTWSESFYIENDVYKICGSSVEKTTNDYLNFHEKGDLIFLRDTKKLLLDLFQKNNQ